MKERKRENHEEWQIKKQSLVRQEQEEEKWGDKVILKPVKGRL